jgi:hypothetical protein
MVTMKPLFLPVLLFIAMAGSGECGAGGAEGAAPADGNPRVQPAASGVLTGSVTVNNSLYNLDDVSVTLFNSGWKQLGTPYNKARVSADRIDYSFPALSPGSYYVFFYISVRDRNPPNTFHIFMRYYPDSPAPSGAAPVVVAGGDTTADVGYFLEHLPPAGSIQCTVRYQHFTGNMDWAYVDLYDTDWNLLPIDGTGIYSTAGLIPDVPPGDYYARFDVWEDDCRNGNPLYCYFPYIPQYYDNSLTREGAVKIHVSESETTVLNPVWIDTDYFICVTTSPKAFSVQVDERTNSAPLYLKWKAGETHQIGVAEYVEEPGVGRYYFDYWKHGGPRIQNYTVPAGTKKDTLVARHVLKLRLDIQSDHGSPTGTGWTRAWSDTLIEVEKAVVEKIPPHAFPAMIPAQADTDSVRYEFNRWEGTGAGSYTGTDNPAAVVMNAPIREKAFWKTQFRLVVLIPDTSMGTVTVDPPGLWQEKGDTVIITARPKPGFAFSGWEGALSGSAGADSVVMDTTRTVTARFAVSLHPPVIAMPDTGWAEDDTLFLAHSEFSRWISDPVDPLETLTMRLVSFSGNIHSSLDADGARFWSDPDWNGTGWGVVVVSDPSGSSVSDTVHFMVTAVDDTPGPFALLEPANGWVSPDMLKPLFRWSASGNRDAAGGDHIRYVLFIGRIGQLPDSAFATSDTSCSEIFLETGTYRWKVKALDDGGESRWAVPDTGWVVGSLQAVEDGIFDMPVSYGLSQNYPNPFNPSTEIGYALPRRDRVRIEIFSPTGKKIRTLVDWERPAGQYTAVWDGEDDSGRRAGSGIYVVRMTAGKFVKSIKMTVMK